MNLSPEQIEHYYRTRLDGHKITQAGAFEWRSQCPVHGGDNNTALKVNTDTGWFVCFACGVKGKDVFAFEQEMQRRETGQVPEFGIVKESISQLLGTPLTERIHVDMPKEPGRGWNRRHAQARYRYTDELGEEQFSVWRFVNREGKKFTPKDSPCRHAGECSCENGRQWTADGARRVLYRLPEVIQSSLVFVVEGEKNADDLSRHLGRYLKDHGAIRLGSLMLDRVAVTTNCNGAQGWKKEYQYGKYLHAKVVIKLGDNDAAGRKHDEDVCKDVSRYALKLFTLALPVGEGEDISDYLAEHTAKDFVDMLPSVLEWKLPEPKHAEVREKQDRVLLVKPSDLREPEPEEGRWIIPGIIEKNTRGLVVAPPKTGKSLLFLDLALCAANGLKFLGTVAEADPVKVAVISREDGPQMVKSRLRQLARGHNLSDVEVDRNIVVNTREQSSLFMIDRQDDLNEMAEWLQMNEVKFTVIDVLNKLHGKEENSSTDMTRVMEKFDELALKSGSQVCVIHHTNKVGGVKGSTAIEGWADYIFNLAKDEGDESIKTITVRTKSSASVPPRTVRYWQNEDHSVSRIMPVMLQAG